MIRPLRAAGAVLALGASRRRHRAGAGGGVGGDSRGRCTFQSLAFQETTVAATEEIVDAWNEANPDDPGRAAPGQLGQRPRRARHAVRRAAPRPTSSTTSPPTSRGFAEQGYLADLTPYLSEDDDAPASPRTSGTPSRRRTAAIIAAPTLLQSYVVFANIDAFEAAGVEVPDR